MTTEQTAGADEIGKRIRLARKSNSWSQGRLAEEAGVSRPSIARIERGRDASIATLAKVAAALDLKIELHGD